MEKTWNRSPTNFEMKNLLQQSIREEVLYREAIALGLDKNDAIVRRRMKQKMEFLFTDISDLSKPKEQQLQQFLVEHSEKFIQSERYSFRHLFYSSDKRGLQAKSDAESGLSIMTASKDKNTQLKNAHQLAMADHFMFDSQFDNVDDNGISRIFGQQFFDKVKLLKIHQWQGPIVSPFGEHLVYIESKQAAYLPPLEAIRSSVVDEFQTAQRQRINKSFYQALEDKYRLRIEWMNDEIE